MTPQPPSFLEKDVNKFSQFKELHLSLSHDVTCVYVSNLLELAQASALPSNMSANGSILNLMHTITRQTTSHSKTIFSFAEYPCLLVPQVVAPGFDYLRDAARHGLDKSAICRGIDRPPHLLQALPELVDRRRCRFGTDPTFQHCPQMLNGVQVGACEGQSSVATWYFH